MRWFIVFAGALVVAAAASDATANPLPCPEPTLSVDGQTVSFGVYNCSCESEDGCSIEASAVVRTPTTDPPTDLAGFWEFDQTVCPEGIAATDVPFHACSKSYPGGGEDAFSGAGGSYYEGVCGTDTCVPQGRWKYLVMLSSGYDCYQFVVDVQASGETCATGCSIGDRGAGAAVALVALALAGLALRRRRSERA